MEFKPSLPKNMTPNFKNKRIICIWINVQLIQITKRYAQVWESYGWIKRWRRREENRWEERGVSSVSSMHSPKVVHEGCTLPRHRSIVPTCSYYMDRPIQGCWSWEAAVWLQTSSLWATYAVQTVPRLFWKIEKLILRSSSIFTSSTLLGTPKVCIFWLVAFSGSNCANVWSPTEHLVFWVLRKLIFVFDWARSMRYYMGAWFFFTSRHLLDDWFYHLHLWMILLDVPHSYWPYWLDTMLWQHYICHQRAYGPLLEGWNKRSFFHKYLNSYICEVPLA